MTKRIITRTTLKWPTTANLAFCANLTRTIKETMRLKGRPNLASLKRTRVLKGENVLGVANALIELSLGSSRELTHMQIQKLCYIAHGFSLALIDTPITSNRIEAWDLGPVYPELYDCLKTYGNRPISGLIHKNNCAFIPHFRGNIVRVELDKDRYDILRAVWKDYHEYSTFELSSFTHEKGTPWSQLYKAGKEHIEIDDASIKEYFLKLTTLEDWSATSD